MYGTLFLSLSLCSFLSLLLCSSLYLFICLLDRATPQESDEFDTTYLLPSHVSAIGAIIDSMEEHLPADHKGFGTM